MSAVLVRMRVELEVGRGSGGQSLLGSCASIPSFVHGLYHGPWSASVSSVSSVVCLIQAIPAPCILSHISSSASSSPPWLHKIFYIFLYDSRIPGQRFDHSVRLMSVPSIPSTAVATHRLHPALLPSQRLSLVTRVDLEYSHHIMVAI